MRENLARNATDDATANSEHVWKAIRYLDPDLPRPGIDQMSSAGRAIVIAILFALLFVPFLCLYLRTL